MLQLPSDFYHVLVGGFTPKGRGYKAMASVHGLLIVSRWFQSPLGAPACPRTDSGHPWSVTAYFQLLSFTEGHEEQEFESVLWYMSRIWKICGFAHVQADCSGQEEQWCFCANKNGRAEDSSFPHDLPGHQGWNHCSARPVSAPAHFSVKSDRLD